MTMNSNVVALPKYRCVKIMKCYNLRKERKKEKKKSDEKNNGEV